MVNSPQRHNAQKLELCQIWYQGHPLYGRELAVLKEFQRGSIAIALCVTNDDPRRRPFHVPKWMLSKNYCARLTEAEKPCVSWAALCQLRHMLDETLSGATTQSVQQRHLSVGGANGKDKASTPAHSADVVRSTPDGAKLGKPAGSNKGRARLAAGRNVGSKPSSRRRKTRRTAR
jgi:hypothetical protein